tara:strand:+ start:1574 stop:2293 length:720 start_codon:yes stop_codon:yes gene_type:complete
MRLINKLFVFSIFTVLAISCSNNKPSDYSTLKQKALEIPPDFQLEPPAEGEEEIVELPGSNESDDIQTILENSDSGEDNSDDVTNKNISLDEFVEENFLTKKETEQEVEALEAVDETALAIEAQKAREELMEIIGSSKEEEINVEEETNVEEEVIVEETSESISEDESDTKSEELAEDFNEEEFLEELADTEDITSLPEEEQLQPMILDDMPIDNTDFGDEDLNDLLNRVDDLLNSYSN